MDPIFIKPLDSELFGELLLKHKRVVTIEEHSIKGGLASEFAQFLSQNQLNETELLSFGVPDRFFEHGSYSHLLEQMGMLPEQMAQRIETHFSLRAAHDRCTVRQ